MESQYQIRRGGAANHDQDQSCLRVLFIELGGDIDAPYSLGRESSLSSNKPAGSFSASDQL